MTFGSLFSGIGGLDLGLERAGMKCRWQIEIDPFCQKVLAKHWPDVKRFGDIKNVKGEELERVDLIAGGFPCQSVSVSGRRLGDKDPRWLWPEFLRIVKTMSPSFVLIENVPGLRTKGLRDVLEGLANAGFDAEWGDLWASDFGAKHYRRRLFILAYSSNVGWQRRRGFESSRALLEPERCSSEYRWQGAIESRPFGVAYGISNRVERLKGIGNAVVPQVAEWIGRRILAVSDSVVSVAV